MIERQIPVSGQMLPVIGIGSWIQFDVASNSAEIPALRDVLTVMRKKGAKVIDSSPMYGRSEETIGDITGKLPFANDFFYATKVWTTGKENGIAQMNESLRKMKRKSIDLMQVHNMQDWRTHIATLNEWKEQGRVRYTGVTHYRDSAHEQLEEIVKLKAVDFVQFNYSIQSVNAEKSLLPACLDNGVAVLVNEPLEKGKLFHNVQGKKLPAWAREIGITNWASFFLKYVIANKAVTCVIPGTSDVKHMNEILEAGEEGLPDEAMKRE
jgi:diketogulonate reductase-like aldo/keto reductase